MALRPFQRASISLFEITLANRDHFESTNDALESVRYSDKGLRFAIEMAKSPLRGLG